MWEHGSGVGPHRPRSAPAGDGVEGDGGGRRDVERVHAARHRDPDPAVGGGQCLVAVVTDVVRDGKRVVGYGFNSNGRYGQGGLIRERFAPRLLEADPKTLFGAPQPAAA